MAELLGSGLLAPLVALVALFIAIVVTVRALVSRGGRAAGDTPATTGGGRVEPHLYASRAAPTVATAPVAPRRQAAPASRAPTAKVRVRRTGFGGVALVVAFVVGGGLGIVLGGILEAPGWETYRPTIERAVGEAESLRSQALAIAAEGLVRLSEALAGDDSTSTNATPEPPARSVEVVESENPPPPRSDAAGAVDAFVTAMDGTLPMSVSPAIDLIEAQARGANLELKLRVKRIVRDRDRSLFVLTAADRTRDIVCNDTETTAIRALSDADVGIAVTYVDADGEPIYEIDLLGGHCSNG